MLWRPFCPPFCLHATDMSEINFMMLNRFFDLKNLYVATKIMWLAQILKNMILARILKKISGISCFGGHFVRHFVYMQLICLK